MKRIICACLATAVLAALVTLTTTASAQNGCSVATLNGVYSWSQTGSEPKNNMGALLPFATLALTTFDGAGNFSATYTDVSPGRPGGYSAPVRGTITGTYTVNSDCTGSMSSPSFGLTWDLVIIGGGTEVFGIATTPFIVATSDFKKL